VDSNTGVNLSHVKCKTDLTSYIETQWAASQHQKPTRFRERITILTARGQASIDMETRYCSRAAISSKRAPANLEIAMVHAQEW
jgi:hypothetical protein